MSARKYVPSAAVAGHDMDFSHHPKTVRARFEGRGASGFHRSARNPEFCQFRTQAGTEEGITVLESYALCRSGNAPDRQWCRRELQREASNSGTATIAARRRHGAVFSATRDTSGTCASTWGRNQESLLSPLDVGATEARRL
jgi:hypothetical protein